MTIGFKDRTLIVLTMFGYLTPTYYIKIYNHWLSLSEISKMLTLTKYRTTVYYYHSAKGLNVTREE